MDDYCGGCALAVMRDAGAAPLALKVTAAGFPGHSLYISGDTEPKAFA
ncbi:hypothetical protein [Mesorhizobium sp. NZP2298]|nr:hypothetical protein [Mesorhizobium sp. NZP2298]